MMIDLNTSLKNCIAEVGAIRVFINTWRSSVIKERCLAHCVQLSKRKVMWPSRN